MKNKLTLLASIILAFGLVAASPVNANSQHQNSQHQNSGNYKQKKSNKIIGNKATQKKVVHIVQQSKSPHARKHLQKIKQRTQYKPSTTVIKIDTADIPLFTVLFSQHNF